MIYKSEPILDQIGIKLTTAGKEGRKEGRKDCSAEGVATHRKGINSVLVEALRYKPEGLMFDFGIDAL